MGYKYQNRLDEANEREYARRMPRRRKIIARVKIAVIILLLSIACFSGDVAALLWPVIASFVSGLHASFA